MKVAIVGGGIAGLTAAWALNERHELTLYEANDELGGHARTIHVPTPRGVAPAATGCRFIIRDTYPHVLTLLELLGVPRRKVSLSVTITRPGLANLVLPPRRPAHLWPLLRAAPRRELWAFRRFALGNLEFPAGERELVLEDYLRGQGHRPEIIDEFLVPVIANSWGTKPANIRRFPAYNIAKLIGRPDVIEVEGGNATTIAALASRLRGVSLRLGQAVRGLRPGPRGQGVTVIERDGAARSFDRVVVATEPWVAARLAEGFDPRWQELLAGFETFPARIAVHRDLRAMPARREDWSTVNLRLDGATEPGSMTMWCGQREDLDVFRTWLGPDDPLPAGTLYEESFHHLLVNAACVARQRQLAALQGYRGLYVVGMYAGDADNHDSALSSALPVADALAPASGVAAALREGAIRKGGATIPRGAPEHARWPDLATASSVAAVGRAV